MLSEDEKAERWEIGCRNDPVRNDFLIPNLIRVIDALKPDRILDIGAGTGYIPRLVDNGLSYRAVWTLIDINSSRLEVSRKLQSDRMFSKNVVADIAKHNFDEQFDCALVTFTMLEIFDVHILINRFPSIVRNEGTLLISLPDTWRDVLEHGCHQPEAIKEYLIGSTSLPKIDKFTNDLYPFKAVRIEHLISRVLASGFELTELTESEGDHAGIYLLSFRRRGKEE
jgi:SAM-dependent methyltransferase